MACSEDPTRQVLQASQPAVCDPDVTRFGENGMMPAVTSKHVYKNVQIRLCPVWPKKLLLPKASSSETVKEIKQLGR